MLECSFQNRVLSFTRTSSSKSEEITHYSPPTRITFYKPQDELASPQTQWSDTHVIENKANRAFTRLEAHYTEPPMSHTEDYPEPRVAYEAREFHQRVQDFSLTKPQSEENDASAIQEPVQKHTEVSVSENAGEPSNVVDVHAVEAVVFRTENIKDKQEDKVVSKDVPETEAIVDAEDEDEDNLDIEVY